MEKIKALWVRRGAVLVSILCASIAGFCQQADFIGKSVFSCELRKLPVAVSDTTENPLGLSPAKIEIPPGSIRYANYYTRASTRTDITFEANQGVRGTFHSKPSIIISRKKDSSLFVFEGDELTTNYKYTLPLLHDEKMQKKVNGYLCRKSSFTGADGLHAIVWTSKALPHWVGPGVYFDELGGIVRIEFRYQQTVWSLNLVSFEKTKGPVDFKKNLPKSNGSSQLHLLFKKT